MIAPLFIVDVQPTFKPAMSVLKHIEKAIFLAQKQDRFIVFLECGEANVFPTENILTEAAFAKKNGYKGLSRYPKIGWIKKHGATLGIAETANWFQTFLPECREVIVGGMYYSNCVNWAVQGCLSVDIIPTVCLDLCIGHGGQNPPLIRSYNDKRIQIASYKEAMLPSKILNRE